MEWLNLLITSWRSILALICRGFSPQSVINGFQLIWNRVTDSCLFFRLVKAKNESIPAEISSKKLTDLGFNFKYDVQDIIQQAVEKCIACGFLPGLLN